MHQYLRIIFLLGILTTLYILLSTRPVSAFQMSNANWVLQMTDNNNFAGEKTGSGYKLYDTGGQTAPGLYSGSGGDVRAGFEYILSSIPFSFTISGEGVTQVNFGIVNPTSPVLRNQTLTISNGSAYGFAVTLQENHSLLVPPSGQTIPDTICDSGPCTTTSANLWTNPLTYGFGYRCDQLGVTNYCPSDFSTANYYRPIANIANNQTPATVMSAANVGRNMQVQITYKLNISGSQAAGLYSNVLQYIATPTF